MLSTAQLPNILDEIFSLPKETEWVEFKLNNDNPQEIGEYISALANSAALHGKPRAFVVWGVDNATHDPIGTNFHPHTSKKGNEELENWLSHGLTHRIDFYFHELTYHDAHLVVLEIEPITTQPVSFLGTAYIRVGSYKKPLKQHPEKERKLWALFSQMTFEQGAALTDVTSDTVIEGLNYPAVFELLKLPLPDNRQGVLEQLAQERFIVGKPGNLFDVTNLGAILLARPLSFFPTLERKTLRVIFYYGKNRAAKLTREQTGGKGYAAGFEGLIDYINDNLPRRQAIGQALREETRMYPEIAIRELVANAIIHQDFMQRGNGPTVEIFTDRIEITNPGTPLIDTLRFIDGPPKSRNEALAAFMRRIGICEELGTGIDKVVSAVEDFMLPAPDFQVVSNSTRVILYGPRSFAEMENKDRIRACYQHACLCHVSNKQLTNQSLRERFGIADKNKAMVTRVITATLKEGIIKPFAPDQSRKFAKYVPFWA